MIRETIREMNMGAIGRVVLTNREKGSLDVGDIYPPRSIDRHAGSE
jgi:hypothetical protein